MPRGPKQYREDELKPFLAHGPFDTDQVGFEKTKSNDPNMKLSSSGKPSKLAVRKRNINAVPVFKKNVFEAFDACAIISKLYATGKCSKEKGLKIIPFQEAKKAVLLICRGRRATSNINELSSLKEFYKISESDLKDITYCQFQNLVTKTFERTLEYGGIRYVKEDSADGKKIIYRLKMSEDGLRRVADVKNYPLQFDPAVTQFNQFKDDDDFIPPFAPYERRYERTEREGSAMNTIGHVWQRYDRLSRPYDKQDFDRKDTELSMFRDVDRLRLISTFFDSFFNLTQAQKANVMADSYPLQQPAAIEALRREWGTLLKVWTWSQPLDAIRDYYGERVAFYFLWMREYCKALTVPAAAGLIVGVLELVFDWEMKYEDKTINVLRGIYCLVLAAWATYFYQCWNRKEREMSLRWGVEVVTGSKVCPALNPYHKPTCFVEDTVNPSKKVPGTRMATLISRKVVATFVAGLVTFVCLVIANNQAFLAVAKVTGIVSMDTPTIEKLVAARVAEEVDPFWKFIVKNNVAILFLPLVLMVKIINKLWDKVIVFALGRYENDPLYSNYLNSVAEKSFVFKFLMNLVPIAYLAFMKQKFIEPCDDMHDGRCIKQTRELLITVILVGLTGTVMEILKPILKHLFKKHKAGKQTMDKMRYVERQSTWSTYDDGNQIRDFQEQMLVYCSIALFSSIFPLFPTVAFLVAMVEIRTDAFKLTRVYKRSWPSSFEAPKFWNSVMDVITLGATISNTLLVGLVTVGYSLGTVVKLSLALGTLITVLCFREFLQMHIPVESKKYKTQKARMHVVMFEAIWGHQNVVKKEAPQGY